MSSTQPVCGQCWTRRRPDQPDPPRIVPEYRDRETCCYCGASTFSGIYTRVAADTVAYPAVR